MGTVCQLDQVAPCQAPQGLGDGVTGGVGRGYRVVSGRSRGGEKGAVGTVTAAQAVQTVSGLHALHWAITIGGVGGSGVVFGPRVAEMMKEVIIGNP